MTTPAAPPRPARRRLVRLLVVGGALAVATTLAFLFVVPAVRRGARIDALTEAEDGNFKSILADDDPALEAALRDALRDGSRSFKNRAGAAKMLLRRHRFPWVEEAFREGDLATRVAALSALQTHRDYGEQVRRDQPARVRETLLEWLGRAGDASRRRALVFLQTPALQTPDALPAIRAMVALPPGGVAPSREESDVRRAAIDALRGYGDCEAVEALVTVARRDPDPQTRLRAMQALASLYRAKGSPCGATLPESTVVEVVHAALAHPGDGSEDRALRLGALGEIERTPAWGGGRAEEIRARLSPGIVASERRQALETLVAMGDVSAIEDVPRLFHDAEPEIRNSAALSVAAVKEPDLVARRGSLLAGFVRDERSPGGVGAFEAALSRLQHDAGAWIGFPKGVVDAGRNQPGALRQFIAKLYADGEARGATRVAIADQWFRHVARRARLDDAQVDAAVALREAFWAKARANDVAGAREALEGGALASSHPEVFLYELGWLRAKTPKG